MGIAAYNRGSRAISRHIDEQLRESREITNAWMHPKERGRFQDMAERYAAALKRRDWSQAWHERRLFQETIFGEPEDFQRLAYRIFTGS